jgi:MoaA/NifB/PqqE/SkfB family radical SAM enzyme
VNYIHKARARAKTYVAGRVVGQVARMLANASDENLIRLTRVVERAMLTDTQRRYVQETRHLFEEKHPIMSMVRSLLSRDIHLNYHRGLVNNLFTNAAFRGYGIRREILAREGITPPSFLVISPTMRCNLRCYGCYAGQYTKADELDYDTVSRIISEAKEIGMYFITISGGEPFYYEGLLDLFEEHHDVSFQVYTNGTLIDEKVTERLVSLGNAAPAISVEGHEAETDARRGKGTYRKVCDTMARLRDARAMFGFSATVTRHNVDLLSSEEFVDTMIDRGCAFGWYFIYIPIGRKPQLDLMPTPEQRDMLRQRVKAMREEKPIFLADFWNDGPWVGGCISGGRRYLHINSKGDVEPCVFVHFAVDNIKNKSLIEVIKSPFFSSIREAQKRHKNLLLPCMIIDHPQALREAIAKHSAYPTHEGAETLVTEMAEHLDNYASEYAKLADEAWKEYGKQDIWTRDVWTVSEEEISEVAE